MGQPKPPCNVGEPIRYGGVWVRQHTFKQGQYLMSHCHTFDHLALLVKGAVNVTIAGVTTQHTGFTSLNVPATQMHEVCALEDDTIWLCVFAVRDLTEMDYA